MSKIVLAAFFVFVVVSLLIIYAALRVSSMAERREERMLKMFEESMRAVKLNPNPAPPDDLFCLAANRPVKMVDFKRAPGCSPKKCSTCRMSVPIDL